MGCPDRSLLIWAWASRPSLALCLNLFSGPGAAGVVVCANKRVLNSSGDNCSLFPTSPAPWLQHLPAKAEERIDPGREGLQTSHVPIIHITGLLLKDLPDVTQCVRSRAGPGTLLPCKTEEGLSSPRGPPAISRVGPAHAFTWGASVGACPGGPGRGHADDAGLGPRDWYPDSSLALGPWAAATSS